MEDLQKIKEFFSKPLKEERDIYDEIANEEFGMDYDQLGPNEKEWVRDEVSNMDEAVTTAYESDNSIEPQFKKDDKVTYLGHPGVITGVNKEMTGAITYNVAYDKGNGRTKVSNLSNKGGEIKPIKEGNHNAENFKPYVVKDRNNPNFLKVFIQYPTGTGFTTALGQRTMTGQDRDYGIDKAMKIGQVVAAKLDSKYNLEDIDVYDNEDGKVIVFAVSDDFIKMNTPLIDEAEEKYTVAGRPVTLNKGKKTDGTDWTVTFENGKSKSLADVLSLIKPMPKGITMNEAIEDYGSSIERKARVLLNYYGYTPIVIKNMSKEEVKSTLEKLSRKMGGSEDIDQVTKILEADKKEDKVDTITMDVPLFLRMLEYSREDAQKDVDLHSVTDKSISLGKEKGILSMEDYEEIVGAAEDAPKDELTEANGFKSGKEFINIKLQKYPKAVSKINQLINMVGESNFTMEMAEWLFDFFNNASFESPVNEAKDSPISAYKVGDILKFKDNEDWKVMKVKDNVGKLVIKPYNEKAKEGNVSLEIDIDLDYLKKNLLEANLTEVNVPSNIKDFAKRKGISSLVNKVAGWAEKAGARIAGGTAVGKNYSTLVLDLDYKQQGEIRIDTDEETVTLYDEPINSFNDFQRVYVDGADNNLEEGEEEQLSFISPARAKSSLRQFLSGKRDDGMGKFDAIVYGIDSDGNKHQIKYYNHLQDYEKFALGDNPDIEEAKNISLDSETIKQIKDDIKGFPKYQKRGFESFKKEVRERYKITPKQLEDILHRELTESKEDIRETIKFIKENNPEATTEEIIAELKEIKVLGEQLNEELCAKGKRYIAARQAAGEKSSAYLSGRGVKVCKGQIQWPKKGKKKK